MRPDPRCRGLSRAHSVRGTLLPRPSPLDTAGRDAVLQCGNEGVRTDFGAVPPVDPPRCRCLSSQRVHVPVNYVTVTQSPRTGHGITTDARTPTLGPGLTSGSNHDWCLPRLSLTSDRRRYLARLCRDPSRWDDGHWRLWSLSVQTQVALGLVSACPRDVWGGRGRPPPSCFNRRRATDNGSRRRGDSRSRASRTWRAGWRGAPPTSRSSRARRPPRPCGCS